MELSLRGSMSLALRFLVENYSLGTLKTAGAEEVVVMQLLVGAASGQNRMWSVERDPLV